ncbi:hypothetical protein TARUN_1235 [Trichoderma arundinaceum]|uniref:Uncharacterized protein n=1 Tax=Trichoderma arundinaceum TaxID=490622 RepID=A0A395NXW5_TRIAR|nr:hypothetical protein TARUN_1235 [Trichoderma arundinaceum]
MGQDTRRASNTQKAFTRAFGSGRGRRESNHGDGQRLVSDAGPGLKRPLTVDRPEERASVNQRNRSEEQSPVHQRDRSEISSPTSSATSGKIQQQNQYRPSDYTSSSDLLVNQKKEAIDEMRRADRRMAEIDDRITSTVQPVLQSISGGSTKSTVASEVPEPSKATLDSIQKTIKGDLEVSFKKEITESQKSLTEHFESRLSELQVSMAQERKQELICLKKTWGEEEAKRISSLKKTWSTEEQKRISSLEETWCREKEERIEEVRDLLNKEIAKNESLGNKVKDLEDRLNKASSEQKKLLEPLVKETQLAQILSQMLDPQEESVKGLEARVDLLEEDSSRIKDLADQALNRLNSVEKEQQKGNSVARLDSLESTLSNHLTTGVENTSADVAEIKVCVENLSLNMQSFGSSMRDLGSSVQDLDLRVQGLSSSHEPATLSDEKILEVIRPELTKITSTTQSMILELRRKLFNLLLQDRQKMETLEEQISSLTRDMSIPANVERATLGQGLDESVSENLGRKLTEISKEEFDEKLHKALHEKLKENNKKKDEELKKKLSDQDQQCTNKIKCLGDELVNRIGTTVNYFENHFEGVFLQLQGLNAWQNNFSTKGLYRDIVQHITRTLPSGTTLQIENLRRRVEVIETRILPRENTPSNKRRKLSGGNSRAVNGHPTDV